MEDGVAEECRKEGQPLAHDGMEGRRKGLELLKARGRKAKAGEHLLKLGVIALLDCLELEERLEDETTEAPRDIGHRLAHEVL